MKVFLFTTHFLFTDEDKQLKNVLKKFEDHFLPKKNLSYERFKFFTRKQLAGETIEQFVTDLKSKALNCDFGDLKDELIKNLLTCGLLDMSLREKLLQAEDSLPLDEAVKLCVSVENSREQSSQMSRALQESSVSVDLVHKGFRKMHQHKKITVPSTSFGAAKSFG